MAKEQRMISLLIALEGVLVLAGIAYAYARTRDVFHPLVLLLPMFGFIYGVMPYTLNGAGTLAKYFTADQLVFVQALNCAGTLAFVLGAITAGTLVPRARPITL